MYKKSRPSSNVRVKGKDGQKQKNEILTKFVGGEVLASAATPVGKSAHAVNSFTLIPKCSITGCGITTYSVGQASEELSSTDYQTSDVNRRSIVQPVLGS